MGTHRSHRLAIAASLLGFTAVAGQAADFYAVDTSTSRLKIVSTAGQLTDVGPLGRTVTDVDLAMLNGHLYAIDSNVGNHVDLLELNPITGSATLLGVVKDGGRNALGAESLAVRNGQLWIGYSFDSSTNSPRLGTIDLSGVIDTNSVVVTNADLDSLVWTGTEWRSVDVNEPTPGTSKLWGGVGPAFSPLATAPNSTFALADLDFVGSSLWGMRTDNTLARFNPDSGAILETVTFASTGTYSNLATVPEPASLSLVAIGGISLLAPRRRQTCLRGVCMMNLRK